MGGKSAGPKRGAVPLVRVKKGIKNHGAICFYLKSLKRLKNLVIIIAIPKIIIGNK